jgi:hypothetical protein
VLSAIRSFICVLRAIRRIVTNAKDYGWSIKLITRNVFSAVLYRIVSLVKMAPYAPNVI